MGSSCSVDSTSRDSWADSTHKIPIKTPSIGDDDAFITDTEDKTGSVPAIPSSDQVYHIIRQSMASQLLPGMSYIHSIPKKGASQSEVLQMVDEYQRMRKCGVDRGRVSGAVYNGSKQLTDFNSKIYEKFVYSNPLHPDIFPDVTKMEAEVIQMCASLFNGDQQACGTMTSGGTESNMLACKAYRDLAYQRGITKPEMIMPRSAHASFEKACNAFKIIPRFVRTEDISMKADVKHIKSLINKNTCMMVASAPNYPHGIIDKVPEMSAIAVKHGIPLHVDCCLGGFLLPFMRKAGYNIPKFDFSLPGVTSIAADTHKYGFAPKGSSVILYRHKRYREAQYFAVTDWPGGFYTTGTLAGSRSGANIAGTWATMLHMGEEGYTQTTKKIICTARYIRDGLKEIEGIFVFGDPLTSVVAVGSDVFDVLRLYEALSKKGWHVSCLQFPSAFHLCCTLLHTQPGVADEFLNDVRECTDSVLQTPSARASGMGALYGASQMIPDRSQVSTYGFAYMNAQYDISKPSDPSTEQHHHRNNDNIDMNNNNMESSKIEQKHKTKSPRQQQQQQHSVLNTIRSISDLSEAERLLK